jgi:predicted class III extradiol MEMO1 family dioxygenase
MKSVNDKRGIIISFFLLLITFIIFLSGVWKPQTNELKKELEQEKVEVNNISIVHTIPFNDLDLINKAYSENKEFLNKPVGKVLGGIIPHHYSVAASVIAGFYEGISSQQVDTVIVIGPDHFNMASHPIVTSLGSFNTLFGTIAPNRVLINSFMGKSGVFVDELPFETELSIYSQLPFIS